MLWRVRKREEEETFVLGRIKFLFLEGMAAGGLLVPKVVEIFAPELVIPQTPLPGEFSLNDASQVLKGYYLPLVRKQL